jgi:hypothetical protein
MNEVNLQALMHGLLSGMLLLLIDIPVSIYSRKLAQSKPSDIEGLEAQLTTTSPLGCRPCCSFIFDHLQPPEWCRLPVLTYNRLFSHILL